MGMNEIKTCHQSQRALLFLREVHESFVLYVHVELCWRTSTMSERACVFCAELCSTFQARALFPVYRRCAIHRRKSSWYHSVNCTGFVKVSNSTFVFFCIELCAESGSIASYSSFRVRCLCDPGFGAHSATTPRVIRHDGKKTMFHIVYVPFRAIFCSRKSRFWSASQGSWRMKLLSQSQVSLT